MSCDGNFESGTEEGVELAMLLLLMMVMSGAGVGT